MGNGQWADGYQNGDEKCALAFKMFCYRAAKFIASYYVPLGHVDAIVFTGGIGENSALVREKICTRLACLGVKFDCEANLAVCGEGVISAPDSPAAVLVLPTNEEVGIAQTIQEKVSAGELKP